MKVIHRRYDTIEFEVLNTDGSFGVANCFSDINYAYRKAPLKVNTIESLSFITDAEEQSLSRGDIYKCNEDGNFFSETQQCLYKKPLQKKLKKWCQLERSN